ncbi:MAG: hypothetical protein ABSE96_16120, partial [Terracidiphilus sp.]
MVRARALSAVLCLALVPVLSSHSRPAFGAATNQAPAAPLDSFIGEYTNPNDPDTPLSFYVREGKLVAESDRLVPTELTPISATEFSQTDPKETYHFTLDAAGHGANVLASDESATYQRTGEPVHHVFHDYQRTEVMIPMRDGIKLHTVILKPADIVGPLPILMQRTP